MLKCSKQQKTFGLNKGIYLVFIPNNITYPENVREQSESINDVEISTFLIPYDEDKWDD